MWFGISDFKTEEIESLGEVLGFNPDWIHPDFNPEGVCLCFLNNGKDWTVAVWCNDHDEWHTKNTNPEINPQGYKPIGAPICITPKPQNPATWLGIFEGYRRKVERIAFDMDCVAGSKKWLEHVIRIIPGMELKEISEALDGYRAFVVIELAANADANIAEQIMGYLTYYFIPISVKLYFCFTHVNKITDIDALKAMPNTRYSSPCLLKARDNEPIFVLLGRDKTAGDIVDCWVNANVGEQPEAKLQAAQDLGNEMRKYYESTQGIEQPE